MIWECMEVFEKLLKEKENLVIENYVPKDGDYYLVHMAEEKWEIEPPVSVFYDKKKGVVVGETDIRYDKICFLDYCSKLLDMNKPIDSKKIIHSNNYLSFFIKKESLFNGKLTQKIIDGYYQILEDPYLKYRSGKNRELYQETEELCGKIDTDRLHRIQQWVKENIFRILEETKDKNYLKLFFVFEDWDETRQRFLLEKNRYLIPNIYNNSKYNENINGKIYGLPNNNLQMNDKKPYLANHSRKIKVPFLLDREAVLRQAEFYDYLEGFAAKGRYNIYIDTAENKIYPCKTGETPPPGMTGYYLRLQKGKEVEIQSVDTVVYYNENMKPEFYYRMYIRAEESERYGMVNKRSVLERLIDEVLFNNMLIGNYFTRLEDLKIGDAILETQILALRERLFSWFHKNIGVDIEEELLSCAWKLAVNSLRKGYWKKVRDQMNLIWSLEEYFHPEKGRGKRMQEIERRLRQCIDEKDWDFESADEFYYAVGQLMTYYMGKSKAYKKAFSAANSIINAGNLEYIKQKLSELFVKYNYDIELSDRRVRNLISHVMGYRTEAPVDKTMIITGLTADNMVYQKKEV